MVQEEDGKQVNAYTMHAIEKFKRMLSLQRQYEQAEHDLEEVLRGPVDMPEYFRATEEIVKKHDAAIR
jgi:hypothetical protein